jgi:PAS domain S-box-containing protein
VSLPETTAARVLLVDDDPSIIHALHRSLAGSHELRYALSGPAALELARQWLPEIILLDAQMPGMTGTEVCRQLKADPALRHIPVVFVTSLDASGAELMSLELGAAGVISKPVEPAALLHTVSSVLAASRSPAEPQNLGDSQATAAADRSASEGDTGDGRPRLLIVDDDPAAVRTIHSALSDLDAHFQFATNGEQALVLAGKYRPDVILLDMYMPGLDGLGTLRGIKSNPLTADALVIIVTRFGHPEMETRALEGGGVDFTSKPYTYAVLKARVGNVLRLREQLLQQREAERERWQRIGNARMARVVAAASDAIITADGDGQVALINAAACKLFGVDAANTIGRPLTALLPEVQTSGDASLQRRRMTITNADGAALPVELSFSVVAHGKERLTTIVLHDLSEAERAEVARVAKAQAETALQAKTMMLSYIAHEIGNPLSSLIGLTQLLQNEQGLSAGFDRQRVLQLVADSGEHLRGLMRDVLDIHRLESGRFDLELARVDAGEAAQRVMAAVRSDADAREISLAVEMPDGPLAVTADKTRLHQCLLNLATNAVKYGRHGGRVLLTVRRFEDQVSLDVQDNGPGLTTEQQARLFEPFNRLGQTGGAGAGVGLALTRMLVMAMQGKLAVQSEAGQGSCFSLRLPLVAP